MDQVPLSMMGRRVVAVSGGWDETPAVYRTLRIMDADLVGVLEYPDHQVLPGGRLAQLSSPRARRRDVRDHRKRSGEARAVSVRARFAVTLKA